METITIDFLDTVAKPADLPRAVEALRSHYMGGIAAGTVRLSAELERVKPAPAPRRQRKRSLASTLKAARRAGANHATVDGVVIALSPVAAAPEAASNEWDAVLLEADHGSR